MQEYPELTIGRYVEDAAAILSIGADSPRLDAEVLMGMVLRRPRSFLHAHPEHRLGEMEAARFENLVRRRFSGEPVAYITGIREFWSMPLRVNRHVLIPRPETELLVEKALIRTPQDEDTRILDLGTGSGAVALALARERPRADVIGVDNSPEAVRIARLTPRC